MRFIDTLTERECVVRPTWRGWVVTDRVGEGGGTKFIGYKAIYEEYLISNRQLSLQLTWQTVGYCFNKQFCSNVHNRKCTDKEQYFADGRKFQWRQYTQNLVGCWKSQQHASVSQGRICSDNCTCCHTEIEAADQTFHVTQSQYTDTRPTSPSADPRIQGAWQGSHWSSNFKVTGMTRPRKIPSQVGFELQIFHTRGRRLNH